MVAYAKTAEEVIALLVDQIIRPVEILLFTLATVLFLWGVVQFIANPENEDKKTTGKRHMVWGLIGLLIMFGVNGLLWVLRNFVEQIK